VNPKPTPALSRFIPHGGATPVVIGTGRACILRILYENPEFESGLVKKRRLFHIFALSGALVAHNAG